jgi:DNA segregation ATPase FtsK/SpoIIIE-like protein
MEVEMDNCLIQKAIELAKENRDCFSVTLLQRKLKIGQMFCQELMYTLEEMKIVAPVEQDRKGRRVLI